MDWGLVLVRQHASLRSDSDRLAAEQVIGLRAEWVSRVSGIRTQGDLGLATSAREGKVIFAVTVDTEADNQWDQGAPLTTENVQYWQPFQSVCDEHGVTPTYLVTSEMAADPSAQSLLARWVASGRAEVGAHLHPWTTPPFIDEPGFRYNDPAHSFLSELPTELVHQKLETLTAEIERDLGIRPTSFRAGRFGFDARCAVALSELGYIVDSSVTPLTEWSAHQGLPHRDGGPDFTSHVAMPFLIDGTPQPGLLELPVTIVTTYALLRRFPLLYRLYRSFPIRPARNRVLKRWLRPQPIWLSPTPAFSISDLAAAWDECQRMGGGVAVMMLHSSELMPNRSPYRCTESSVGEMLAELDAFFRYARGSGARAATLTSAARELTSSRPLEARAL